MNPKLIYIEIPRTLGFIVPFHLEPVVQALPIRTFIEHYEIPSSSVPGFFDDFIVNDVIQTVSIVSQVSFEEVSLFYQNVSETFWYEIDSVYDYSVETFKFFRWQNSNGLLIIG